MNRVFLGWDRPFIHHAVDWLWERRETFATTLLVVPTTESGRKVRQALAERGACLAPTTMTAGRFGTMGYSGSENLLLEQLVWEQVLSRFDWAKTQEIFPKPQAQNWERELATQLGKIRIQTGEYGYSFTHIARRLGETHPDSVRWSLLARWEGAYLHKMETLGVMDSFAVRNGDYTQGTLPPNIERVVMLCVSDPTEQAVRMAQVCGELGREVDILISAPETVAEGFDAVGRPLPDYWEQQQISWSNDLLYASNSPEAQADLLKQHLGELTATRDTPVGLGMGDQENAPVLQALLKKDRLTLYNPAGSTLKNWSYLSWIQTWLDFVSDGQVEDLRKLAQSPWTLKLLSEPMSLYSVSYSLQFVSDAAKPHTLDDLFHLNQSDLPFVHPRSLENTQSSLRTIIKFVACLKQAREDYRGRFSLETLRQFLTQTLGGEDCPEAIQAELILEQLEQEVQSIPPEFTKSLNVLHEFTKRLEQVAGGEPRENVHLEALGWLELAFESAPNLLITGLNEGILPNTSLNDSWLPESLREHLGMRTNRHRFTHDLYYLHALLSARVESGEVRGYFLSYGKGGEPQQPSRLLLHVSREELPARVEHCFNEKKPHNLSAQPWSRQWQLSPLPATEPLSLSASSIRTYLACPFRYYLKNLCGMGRPTKTLYEWDNMEFGTIIHRVMEDMEHAAHIRTETDVNLLRAWLHNQLDLVIAERFKDAPPLSFQIQRESMRQRLTFFAHQEVEARTTTDQDWTTVGWELPFKFELEGITIKGVIDRLDQHRDGRHRLVDYKTGSKKAREAHLRSYTSATPPAHHLDTPLLFDHGGKTYYWTDLQLPIYALWHQQEHNEIPEVCYCLIADTKEKTQYDSFELSTEHLESAREALVHVIQQIKDNQFWEPAEKVTYDDYEAFSYGGYPLQDAFTEPPPLLPQPTN